LNELYLAVELEVANAGATAAPPYPLPRRSLMATARQFGCVVWVMLAEYRTNWFYHTFFGTLVPIGLFFFFTFIAPQLDSRRALYLLSGNMATSIVYGPMHLLIVKMGWSRQTQQFDYWATLPVPRLMLILAMVFVYLLFAMPGLVTSYLVGCWLLHLPIANGLTLISVAPLAVISLTGLGAFLGSYAKDGQTASVYAQLVIGVVTFLTPTVVPPEVLPAPMRICGWIMPTTYVAAIFRAALEGRYDSEFVADLLILVGFSVGSLVLVQRKLDWRAT